MLQNIWNELIEKNKVDALVVYGQANKRYMGTLTGSGVWVVVTPKKCYQLMDERYTTEALTLKRNFETIVLKQGNNLKGVLTFLKSLQIKKVAVEENYLTMNQGKLFETFRIETVFLNQSLENIRRIKTPEEIKKLKKACEITDSIYTELLPLIKAGMTEKEIAGELFRLIYRHGAEGVSFDPIVCSGVRSAMPHARASDKLISYGELLLIDFGVVYQGYQSDMTRTLAIGDSNALQKEIYQKVLLTQKKALEACIVGKSCREIHEIAVESITSLNYGKFFNHGLGHGLGLGHGDGPIFNAFSIDYLEENMVFTCEPGIYLPDIGGVRIEDDILMTKSGPEYLTHSDRELKILEV